MANNTEFKTVTEYVRAGKSYSIVVDEATDQLYKVTPAGRKFKVDVDGAYDAVAGDGDALAKLQAYFAVDTDDAVKADDTKVDYTVVETEKNDDKIETDKVDDVKTEESVPTDATDDAVVVEVLDGGPEVVGIGETGCHKGNKRRTPFLVGVTNFLFQNMHCLSPAAVCRRETAEVSLLSALRSYRHLQFETLCVANHTACRFAEKTQFFRSIRAWRRYAAASRFTLFKVETL